MARVFVFSLACFSASSCVLWSTGSTVIPGQTPVEFKVTSPSICQTESGFLVRLELPDRSLLVGNTAKLIPSGVADAVAITAIVEPGENAELLLRLPADVAPGVYDVVLEHGGVSSTQARALTVKSGPVMTSVGHDGQSGGVCTQAGSTFLVHGSGLAGASGVSVQGNDGVVVSLPTVSVSESELRVSALTALVPGTYNVAVTGENGCRSSLTDALLVSTPPSDMLLVAAAPQVAEGGILNAAVATTSAPVRVRLSGVSAPVGRQVSVRVGSVVTTKVEPSSRVAGTVEAEFEAGALSALSGMQDIVFDSFGCTTTAFGLKLSASTMRVEKVNPSVLNMNMGKGFIDIYTNVGSRQMTAYVDTAVDPLVHNWVALERLYALDGNKRKTRFLVPDNISSGAFLTYVKVVSGGSEVAAAASVGSVTLTEGAMPHMLVVSRDSLHAGVSDAAKNSFYVHGCALTGAAFSLENAAGTQLPLTVLASSAEDTWTTGNLKCRYRQPSNGTDLSTVTGAPLPAAAHTFAHHAVQLGAANIPAGDYRLILTTADGARAEHPYPIVVYPAAPTFRSPNFAALPFTLDTARRSARAGVLSDVLGKKFMLLVGGDTGTPANMNPAGVSTTAASYEVAEVDTDHNLVRPDDPNAAALDKLPKYPLKSFTFPGSNPTVRDHDQTYGAALSTDGVSLFLSGGTKNGQNASPGTSSADTLDRYCYASLLDRSKGAPPNSLPDIAPDEGAILGVMRCTASATLPAPVFGHGQALLRTDLTTRSLVTFGGVTGATLLQDRLAQTSFSRTPLFLDSPSHSSFSASPSDGRAFFSSSLFFSPASGLPLVIALGGFYNPTNLFPSLPNQSSLVVTTTTAALSTTAQPATFWGESMVSAGQSVFTFGGVYTDDGTPAPFLNTRRDGSFDPASAALLAYPAGSSVVLDDKLAMAEFLFLPPYVYRLSGAACTGGDDSATDCANMAFAGLLPGIAAARI